LPFVTTPKLVRKQLGGPGDVGQLANINGQFAIVSVAMQDPQRRLTVAGFDPTVKSFLYQDYQGAIALVFSGEKIFEPDLAVPFGEESPGPNSGATAFVDSDNIYVVMRLIDGSDWRLVALNTGHIVKWDGSPMHAFHHWKLLVADTAGRTSTVFGV
jgi:hypothetical protein